MISALLRWLRTEVWLLIRAIAFALALTGFAFVFAWVLALIGQPWQSAEHPSFFIGAFASAMSAYGILRR